MTLTYPHPTITVETSVPNFLLRRVGAGVVMVNLKSENLSSGLDSLPGNLKKGHPSCQSVLHPSTHSSINLLIFSLIHLFILLFVHSSTHPSMCFHHPLTEYTGTVKSEYSRVDRCLLFSAIRNTSQKVLLCNRGMVTVPRSSPTGGKVEINTQAMC